MIDTATADLIDAIADRELFPYAYSGRGMHGEQCVACTIPRGSDMSHLPKFGCSVDHMGLDYVAYWPQAAWTPDVQKYVDIIFDSSGEAR